MYHRQFVNSTVSDVFSELLDTSLADSHDLQKATVDDLEFKLKRMTDTNFDPPQGDDLICFIIGLYHLFMTTTPDEQFFDELHKCRDLEKVSYKNSTSSGHKYKQQGMPTKGISKCTAIPDAQVSTRRGTCYPDGEEILELCFNKPEYKPKEGKDKYVLGRPILCKNASISLINSQFFQPINNLKMRKIWEPQCMSAIGFSNFSAQHDKLAKWMKASEEGSRKYFSYDIAGFDHHT